MKLTVTISPIDGLISTSRSVKIFDLITIGPQSTKRMGPNDVDGGPIDLFSGGWLICHFCCSRQNSGIIVPAVLPRLANLAESRSTCLGQNRGKELCKLISMGQYST